MSEPKLSLRDVRVRRGKADIVKVPHLDVLEGEVLVIVGPNGAGKTILLETLDLLQRPSAGRVLFEGQPVDGRELALRRRMAVVFQDPLLLRRSVADNVAMGLRLRGAPRSVRREKAAHWMGRFGIAHLAGRSAVTISGGEAQRANLAAPSPSIRRCCCSMSPSAPSTSRRVRGFSTTYRTRCATRA